MRHVGDSGCGGLAGSPGGRRRARVSSCIWLYPEHRGPRGVTGPGAAVSGVTGRGEAQRLVVQGYLTHLSPPGDSGTPCIPVLSHPSTTSTSTHGVAKRELWVASMSLPAPWCPCLHPGVPATTLGSVLPHVFFLPA